ncbi:major facilitator superfamily domain-containing protein [Xylariales sp. PMI_506]|nr:major facilitator superfamily domain-containing protein [Xylariales sp. PMI_506]
MATISEKSPSVDANMSDFDDDTLNFPSGAATPDALLAYNPYERVEPLPPAVHHHVDDHVPASSGEGILELGRVRSRAYEDNAIVILEKGKVEELLPSKQGVPPELKNLFAEIIFVLVNAFGQVVFAISLGQVMVTQTQMKEALGISPTQIPWLIGSSLLASGLSVVISGSLADLVPPKPMMVGAFVWQAAWYAVAAGSVRPELKILFFVARAMGGLSIGVLVSVSMSILGRVYSPGIRKTRVFSLMASGAPLGYWIGCIQGGALAYHLPWIFGSTSMFLAICAVAAQLTIPSLQPAKDEIDGKAPSFRDFDYLGAVLASVGCGLLLFGLTQGSSSNWNPYAYSLIIIGVLLLVALYFVEGRVTRPLIPNALWKTRGFFPLMLAYFLGFGGFNGAWQFYAMQFWQRYQGASPLTTALYTTPNLVLGIFATWLVSKTLHVFPNHWILTGSMFCFALGPVFFLWQTATTPYWALSMPGVALSTLGPDMSFAAAAIFITSSVPKSYQGAAGSLLVTIQNLSSAVITSVSDSIGTKVDALPDGTIGLNGLHAIWWFGFGCSLCGALITATMVRIPKAEEKEHAT